MPSILPPILVPPTLPPIMVPSVMIPSPMVPSILLSISALLSHLCHVTKFCQLRFLISFFPPRSVSCTLGRRFSIWHHLQFQQLVYFLSMQCAACLLCKACHCAASFLWRAKVGAASSCSTCAPHARSGCPSPGPILWSFPRTVRRPPARISSAKMRADSGSLLRSSGRTSS